MLQEMAEEWEQCERKLNETREWIEKSHQSLTDSSKRPIRDQLALREKTSGEVPVQRTKAVMAVEKLRVHFSNSPQCGSKDVNGVVAGIEKDLDSLTVKIKEQISTLEACLTQLDQYQQV